MEEAYLESKMARMYYLVQNEAGNVSYCAQF